VAFSPDGKLLPTASADHTTQLWNLRFTSWVIQGCKIVNRNPGPTRRGRELQKTLQPPTDLPR
jgi:WD40 repeat protein